MELDRASEIYSVAVFVVAWKLWFVTRLHVLYMTSFNVSELAWPLCNDTFLSACKDLQCWLHIQTLQAMYCFVVFEIQVFVLRFSIGCEYILL